MRVVDFWLGMGVDGLRLDAVPYLYEREGTTCENLPETHAFLNELRRHVDRKHKSKMLLAEANQWPEERSRLFRPRKACHMPFIFRSCLVSHVGTKPRSVSADDIWAQTPDDSRFVPMGLFLAKPRRAHAGDGHRRRARPTFTELTRRGTGCASTSASGADSRRCSGNNRRTIELLKCVLSPLPGTPVSTTATSRMGDTSTSAIVTACARPMQWSGDRNAASHEPIRRS